MFIENHISMCLKKKLFENKLLHVNVSSERSLSLTGYPKLM